MYADDTKLYSEIKSPDDHQILQNDLSKLCTWSKKWLLKFHPKKCSCLTIGKKLESPSYSYDLSSHITEQVKSIKDIGITMDSELSFDKHINIKIDTANKIVGIIRQSYRYLNCEIFLPLYICLVRSHFDYAVSVWDPYKVKHITDIELEDVQRRATKLIPEIKKICYPERLKKLNLPTLAYRRIRGQMIEVYKIINNIHNSKVSDKLLAFRKNVASYSGYCAKCHSSNFSHYPFHYSLLYLTVSNSFDPILALDSDYSIFSPDPSTPAFQPKVYSTPTSTSPGSQAQNTEVMTIYIGTKKNI